MVPDVENQQQGWVMQSNQLKLDRFLKSLYVFALVFCV